MRPWKLGLSAVAAALGVLLAGCAERPVEPAPAEPSSTPAPARPQPTTGPSSDQPAMGLDIRYLDADGKSKVLRVKDFPR